MHDFFVRIATILWSIPPQDEGGQEDRDQPTNTSQDLLITTIMLEIGIIMLKYGYTSRYERRMEALLETERAISIRNNVFVTNLVQG